MILILIKIDEKSREFDFFPFFITFSFITDVKCPSTEMVSVDFIFVLGWPIVAVFFFSFNNVDMRCWIIRFVTSKNFRHDTEKWSEVLQKKLIWSERRRSSWAPQKLLLLYFKPLGISSRLLWVKIKKCASHLLFYRFMSA